MALILQWSYLRSGFLFPGWVLISGVGSYFRDGFLFPGWVLISGVGSYFPGWVLISGMGSYFQGGFLFPGWVLISGVGSYFRDGFLLHIQCTCFPFPFHKYDYIVHVHLIFLTVCSPTVTCVKLYVAPCVINGISNILAVCFVIYLAYVIPLSVFITWNSLLFWS